jgi:cupin fold WbuC family metalloprotein
MTKSPLDLERDQNAKSISYYSRSESPYIDNEIINWISDLGKNSQDSARICLHSNANDLLHEMLIFQRSCSFYPPKKHAYRDKSFHILRGVLAIIIFDEIGEIKSTQILQPKEKFYYRIRSDTYHLDYPVTDSVHLEVVSGPFNQGVNILADWFCDETKKNINLALNDSLRDINV